MELLDQAEDAVTSTQSEPTGTLRITAPGFLGTYLLPRALVKCAKAYPKIQIEVLLKDRSMDLIAERVDLALRAGELYDSTLIAKKLGTVEFSAFASPAYLKANPKLSHPKDLNQHTCIQFSPLGNELWRFSNGKNGVSVPLDSRLVVDELHLAKALAIEGAGITLLPNFVCVSETKQRRLVRVLPNWQALSRKIQFVHLPQKFPSPKLKAFLELASESIQKQLSGV
jgi:DNA-binding transcriptional LysR family regulator